MPQQLLDDLYIFIVLAEQTRERVTECMPANVLLHSGAGRSGTNVVRQRRLSPIRALALGEGTRKKKSSPRLRGTESRCATGAHLDQLRQDRHRLARCGMAPEEAFRQARRELGGIEQVKQSSALQDRTWLRDSDRFSQQS
jgi:hypothetical protein